MHETVERQDPRRRSSLWKGNRRKEEEQKRMSKRKGYKRQHKEDE